MECRMCGHPKTYKHGKMPNGNQRYFCPNCQQTSSECFDTLYYWRRVRLEQVQQVLQAHSKGSSLRGISRITGLAYNTAVSIVRSASIKAQLVHNHRVEPVQTEESSVDEMWGHLYVLSVSTYRLPQRSKSTASQLK